MIGFTDEQQQWIDSHYLLLPVDADGVPIHVGDRVKLLHNGAVREVTGLTRNPNGSWCVSCDSGGAFMLPESQGNVERAKPRTLEDVLKELACDVRREWVENAPLAEHVYSEYADEIRELIGGAE